MKPVLRMLLSYMSILLFFLACLPIASQAHMVCMNCKGKNWQITDDFMLQCLGCQESFNSIDVMQSFDAHSLSGGGEGFSITLNHYKSDGARAGSSVDTLMQWVRTANADAHSLLLGAGFDTHDIMPMDMLYGLVDTYSIPSASVRQTLAFRLALLASGIWEQLYGNLAIETEHRLQMATQFPYFFLNFQQIQTDTQNSLALALSDSEADAIQRAEDIVQISNAVSPTEIKKWSSLLRGNCERCDRTQHLENMMQAMPKGKKELLVTLHPVLGRLAIIGHGDDQVSLVTHSGVVTSQISIKVAAQFLLDVKARHQMSLVSHMLWVGLPTVAVGALSYIFDIFGDNYLRHFSLMSATVLFSEMVYAITHRSQAEQSVDKTHKKTVQIQAGDNSKPLEDPKAKKD